MDILPFKYQATVFCNNDDVKPDPKLVQELFNGLIKWEIFPNFTKEINIKVNGLSAKPEPVDRLQFISSDKSRRINFLSNRIDFEQFFNTTNKTLSLEEYAEIIIEQFGIIGRLLPKKYNRMSFVSVYFCPTESQNFYDDIYTKIYKTPLHFAEAEKYPSEWNNRTTFNGMISVNGKPERMNYVTAFGRRLAIGGAYVSQSDRLEFVFDLNTHQNSQLFRFNQEDVKSFYQQIASKSKALKDSTLSLFNV